MSEINQELEDFKAKVADVAVELAKQHDWCDVVERALTDSLGIDPKVYQNYARITLEIVVPRHLDHENEHDVRRHLKYGMEWSEVISSIVSIEPVKKSEG